MHDLLKNRVLPVLAGAVVVVAGANVASYAANGHPLTLGGHNVATRPTILTNTGSSPVLVLRAAKDAAPLRVNSDHKIAHLNADTVDGLDGRELRTNATRFTVPGGATTTFALNGVEPGRYLATFDVGMNATTNQFCGLAESSTAKFSSLATGSSSGTLVAVSATAVITHPAGSTLMIVCSAPLYDGATVFSNTVALSPVGRITKGGVTASKLATRQLPSSR